jgi:hypothetical protein
MGGGSSRPTNGEAYSKQAAEAKKLPDQILTLFFSNANLMKLLKLHNIGECSRFVFTTSSELATLFQKLQVYPKLGAKGEILFAPVSDLAAGLLSDADKNSSNQAKLQEKIHSRNELCVDIAYFYVRIFQIYSALALTVIEADPLRKKRFAVAPNPMYASKPQNSPLGGGSRVIGHPIIGSGPLIVQQGGAAISKTGKFKDLYSSIVNTPFVPLLGLVLLETVIDTEERPQRLKLVDKRPGTKPGIFLYWDWPSKAMNNYEVQGKIKRDTEKNIILQASKTDDTTVMFNYNDPEAGTVQQKFKRSISGQWEFEYDDITGKPGESSLFFENIYQLYSTENKKSGSNVTSSSSSSAVSSISSASAFEGFDKLKTIFEDKTKKGKEFPKAYCMARLMTLINPVFGSELSDPNQPYYSQICRTKYDFETTEYMPRAGKAAKSNDYLRSFTSLYYDAYKYNRGTGKLELTQTEPSRTSLIDASNKFAKMYNIPGDQPNFLFDSGGAVNFTPFRVCDGKADKLLRIKGDKVGKDFLAILQKECVDKMLEFQKQHTIKVNKLLMKMFKIEKTPLALKLQPAIKSGGIDAINKIGVEAHDLLMDYYLKSEAFYIRGVTLFQTNPNAYDAV